MDFLYYKQKLYEIFAQNGKLSTPHYKLFFKIASCQMNFQKQLTRRNKMSALTLFGFYIICMNLHHLADHLYKQFGWCTMAMFDACTVDAVPEVTVLCGPLQAPVTRMDHVLYDPHKVQKILQYRNI